GDQGDGEGGQGPDGRSAEAGPHPLGARAHVRSLPMRSLTWRRRSAQYAARPSSTFLAAVGSAKLAVPTCTAVAPARRNSTASSVVAMPPMPITGIFTARASSHTMRRAIGLSAGPERPPVLLARRGRQVRG